MKVREIMLLLEQCDPEAEVIVVQQGYEEANFVLRYAAIGEVGNRLSYDRIKAVEIGHGSYDYLREQGYDVLAAP